MSRRKQKAVIFNEKIEIKYLSILFSLGILTIKRINLRK